MKKSRTLKPLMIHRGRAMFTAAHRDLDRWVHLVDFGPSTIMNLRDLKRVHVWIGKVIKKEQAIETQRKLSVPK